MIKEPTLLHVDKKNLELSKKMLKKQVKKLNDFITQAERTTSLNLDKEQRGQLTKRGTQFLIEILSEQFPFPNATNEFNLDALGVDLTPLTSTFEAQSGTWLRHDFNQREDGLFFIEDIDNHPEVKRHFKYCQTDRQEQAFKIASATCRALNKMEHNGLNQKYGNGVKIDRVTKLIEYVRNGEGGFKFIVNWNGVYSLK